MQHAISPSSLQACTPESCVDNVAIQVAVAVLLLDTSTLTQALHVQLYR